MNRLLTAILFAGLWSSAVSAQEFLQTDVLEFTISPCGTFTNNIAPPPGYHPNLLYGTVYGFGIVTDPAEDGWETGTPTLYTGDHVFPGSPVEGFSVQIGEEFRTNINSFDDCASAGIYTNDVSTAVIGDLRLASWTGSRNGLSIRQSTVTKAGEPMMIHRVKLCNNSGAALDSVFYQRYMDADSEQPWTGNFVTKNVVLPDLEEGSAVESFGQTFDNCRIAIISPDERAQGSIGGFFGDRPSFGYYGENFFQNSGVFTGDVGIQMTFNLGTLEPGECDCAAFAYAFKRSDYDRAYGIAEDACTAFESFDEDGDAGALASRLYGSNQLEISNDLTWIAFPQGFQLTNLSSGDQVQVYDLSGRLVNSSISAGNIHPVSSLIAGMYIIEVRSQSGAFRSGKAVVQ